MGPKIPQQVIDKLNSLSESNRKCLENIVLTIPKTPNAELQKRLEELKQQIQKK